MADSILKCTTWDKIDHFVT